MLRRTMLAALGLLALPAMTISPLPAATFYVDQDHPRTSDGNAGSEESPWKTINHAATGLRARKWSEVLLLR